MFDKLLFKSLAKAQKSNDVEMLNHMVSVVESVLPALHEMTNDLLSNATVENTTSDDVANLKQLADMLFVLMYNIRETKEPTALDVRMFNALTLAHNEIFTTYFAFDSLLKTGEIAFCNTAINIERSANKLNRASADMAAAIRKGDAVEFHEVH